jgi:hypothetical protein
MNLALSESGTQLITAALRAGNTTPCAKIQCMYQKLFYPMGYDINHYF